MTTSKRRVWIFAAASLWFAACGRSEFPGPERTRVRLDLIAEFPDAAAVPGAVSSGSSPPSVRESEAGLRQPPGSAVAWSYLLPAAAVLRGEAVLRAATDPRTVTLSLVDAAGAECTLFEETLEADRATPLELDLGDCAGELAQLHIEVASSGGPTQPGEVVEWRELWIEGHEPAWPSAVPNGLRGRYNVLLIVFDTLRVDRLAAFARTRVETPNLSRLAERGTLFEDAFTNATYTTASVASMLTSVDATAHGISGVRYLGGNPTLPDALPYLPEILQSHGFATLFLVNNPMLDHGFGFDRGFDRFESHRPRRARNDDRSLPADATPSGEANHVWDDVVAPFLADTRERPFFVYLHDLDPHHPYTAPEPWGGRYVDDDYRGRMDGFRTRSHFEQATTRPRSLNAADVKRLNALYDGEVGFMDAYLGELLRRLEAADLERETLVIFASDHGESIGERLQFGHGDKLGEEVVRVPLLLSLPGVIPEGRRISTRVQLLDLAPTVLDLLGLEVPEGMRGRSLLPLLVSPEPPVAERTVFSGGHFNNAWSRHVVRLRDWKLVRHNAGPEEKLARDADFLYDLASDPGEKLDRSDDLPVVAAVLQQQLAKRIREDALVEPWRGASKAADAISPEERKQLRSLGYTD